MMSSYSNSSRKRSYRLLLVVLALGMATVSVMLLHKLREGRLFGLILQDQDRQIMTLQVLLQRERGKLKEMNQKLENMKAKNFLLRTQNMELANKLSETRTTADRLQTMQSEMETSLEAKQNQIKGLAERAEGSIRADLRVTALTDLLKQKETEVEEMKQQLQKLGTEENNTTSQAATSETPTDSPEGTEDSNANEANNEQNEVAPKREWMQLQTNVDDDASKDNGEASDEASHDHQTENPTNSQEKESSEEGQEMSKEGASDAEQSEETKNGEGKADSEASKEKEAEKSRETEMSQESTKDVQEQSERPQHGQEASNDMEKSEPVVAQVVEPAKLETPQDGNEQKVALEEPTKDAASKEHKVRRRKSRGKGRRQRRAASSKNEDNRDETKGNNEVQDEQKIQALDAPKSEVREGYQVAGSGNGEGQHNSGTVAEPSEEIPVSSYQQLENVQSQEEGKGSKVEGDSSTTVTQEEENERTSTQEPEIPEDMEGKDENKEKENNVEKQVTKDEVGTYTTSISTQMGSDNTAAGKAEGLNVQGESTNKTVEAEHAEKPENAQRDEANSENIDETRASTAEKEGAAENQNGMVTEEEGGDTTSTSIT